jgi:hypothetical protein
MVRQGVDVAVYPATTVAGQAGLHRRSDLTTFAANFAGAGRIGQQRNVVAEAQGAKGEARFAFAQPALRVETEKVQVVDQFADRKGHCAADHKQDRPHRIVDLFLEIGERLRSLLRTHEQGAEEKDNGHRGHDDPNEFEHGANSISRCSLPE